MRISDAAATKTKEVIVDVYSGGLVGVDGNQLCHPNGRAVKASDITGSKCIVSMDDPEHPILWGVSDAAAST
jgi:hypothetical protein